MRDEPTPAQISVLLRGTQVDHNRAGTEGSLNSQDNAGRRKYLHGRTVGIGATDPLPDSPSQVLMKLIQTPLCDLDVLGLKFNPNKAPS